MDRKWQAVNKSGQMCVEGPLVICLSVGIWLNEPHRTSHVISVDSLSWVYKSVSVWSYWTWINVKIFSSPLCAHLALEIHHNRFSLFLDSFLPVRWIFLHTWSFYHHVMCFGETRALRCCICIAHCIGKDLGEAKSSAVVEEENRQTDEKDAWNNTPLFVSWWNQTVDGEIRSS